MSLGKFDFLQANASVRVHRYSNIFPLKTVPRHIWYTKSVFLVEDALATGCLSFENNLKRADEQTVRRTDGMMDGQTRLFLELRCHT